MAVRHPGDDERATVDLGPRPELRPGDEDPGDLGDEPATATQTVTPNAIHAQSTQRLPPRGHAQTESSRYTTTTSPSEAMRLEELSRSEIFLRIAIVTAVAGLIVALFTDGDPIAFRLLALGCGVNVLGAIWMLLIIRQPTTYSGRKILPPALVIALGAFGGVYYWGVASPVAAMITYGIYFFSLGSLAGVIGGMYILVAIVHAALGFAIIGGVIDDRGIISMAHISRLDQIGVIGVIEFLYFITFYTARTSQRVTLDAMQRLEQAVRGVAQREALLAEARAELDRALKIGGPGRFTDQTVGAYTLGVLIGRGGMGEVYEAHSTADDHEAAVKLLHAGTLAEPTHVTRFIREAETASKLTSPNVVRVLQVGTTAGEVPFLAMERLRGVDLAQQLRRSRRLALPEAAVLAREVAAGLDAARAAGIVHRDLKPHNVFAAETGDTRVWKILDFGVSKSGGTGTLTRGHVIGTPAYMAPEQAKGEDVDHRADVYSLAAILYRAITGHPAFTGKDVPTTLYDVVFRIPTQPSMLAPLPADVDRVLGLGLAKQAADRFATATELAAWFTAAIRDGLDHEQRRRADDLLGRHPWGTRQT
ncbi:MAG TPA: serine/threonine-protein kinase [Kofleriaceae bacterium]